MNKKTQREDNMKKVAVKERKAIAEYEITPEKINALVKQYEALSIIPGDTKAYGEVRAAKTICVRTRTGIDKRRKDLGSDARSWILEVNAAAKQLTEMIAPAESHLREELDREDGRKDAIKQQKADEEQARVDAIRAKITDINSMVRNLSSLDAEQLDALLDEIGWFKITPRVYQEFTAEAMKAKLECEQAVTDAYNLRVKLDSEEAARVAEDARLKAVRKQQADEAAKLEEQRRAIEAERQAELKKRQEADRIAQQKIDAAQREREDAARKIQEAQAAAQKKIDGERAELEANKKAEQDRIAREVFEKQAVEAAKIQTEADRLATERAEADRKAREEELRPDKEKLAAYVQAINVVPVPAIENNEMSNALAEAIITIKKITSVLIDWEG